MGSLLCRPVLLSIDPFISMYRLVWWCCKVRDPVLGRVGNPFLIVGVEHRGLNIGMPKHILDLVDRGAVFESDRGR